ncbi:MAG: VCBS repeat-containing protein [Planctomycetaceae bacterium]|nr:FG-GAP-like repeat-containing protein [Planctomycetota bacterium]NUN51720.1 VCBS repeat-containing protein [Planctomycetaceae bacterium]
MGVTLVRGIAVVLAAGLFAPAAFSAAGIRVIPNDRRMTAISSSSDTDEFLFDGVEGGRLSVSVKRTSGGLDPVLSLRDANGTSVPLGDDLSLSDGVATLSGFRLPATGGYVIVVSGDDGSTGGYQLKLTASKIPAEGRSTALPPHTTSDVPFLGISGGAVNFRVRHTSGPHTQRPLLLDPVGVEVPGSADLIRHDGDSWIGRRIPLVARTGTYRLRLVGPASGDPSAVVVDVRGLYSPGKATKVRLPVVEPVVLEASPFARQAGQPVTLTGENFSPQARVRLVRALETDVPVEVTSVGAGGTLLTFDVPEGTTGVYDIVVENPEGQSATLPGSVSVNSGVTGSAGVEPSTGPAAGGTLVVVTGTGFVNGITVSLVSGASSVPVAVTFINSDEIRFTTPAHAGGTVDIVLTNPGASPVTRSGAFTFTDQTVSRFYADGTSDALPAVTQSGDGLAATRGAVADLDGDGDQDLVLQSSGLLPGGASLRILHNDGTGEFADDTHRSIPDRFGGFSSAMDLGEGPGLALGDLDGDALPEIVLVSRGFVPRTTGFAGGSLGYFVANGEGEEFFSYSESAGKVGDFDIFWNDHYAATRVFKNDGNGNFFSSPLGPGSVRRIPRIGFFVEAADAAAAYARSYQATYDATTMTYKGDPGFVDFGTDGGERFEGDAVAVGDLDGDGTNDLVVSSDAPVVSTYAQTFLRAGGLKPFDAFQNFNRSSTRVLLNPEGDGVFAESASPLLDPSLFSFPDTGYDDRGQAADVAVGDLDGDGRNDIVLVSDRRFTLTHTRPGVPVTEYRTGTRIFLNRGDGRFDDATRSNLPVVDIAPVLSDDFFAASRVALGDVDGDGDLDMILSTATGVHVKAGRPYTRVLKNRNDSAGDPTGIFDDVTRTHMPANAGVEVWQADSLSLVDIDSDGDLDMVLASTDPALNAAKSGTRVLVNDGTGKFDDNPAGVSGDTFIPPSGGGETWAGDLVLSGDLDGDGFPDLVISEDDPLNATATRILFHK